MKKLTINNSIDVNIHYMNRSANNLEETDFNILLDLNQ